MPNRIIRDAILDSDRYVSLTHDSERLLYIELLLLADDFGLVPLNFAFLRRRASPCAGKTEHQINEMLGQMIERDLIRTYRSDSGSLFGFIPRFGNAPRAKKPKWPMPPDSPGFNEIKYLAQNRVANAVRLHTNEPETETETETDLRKVVVGAANSREQGSTAPAPSAPACPHQEIIALWAEKLPTAIQPREWTPTRQKHLQARWREKRKRQNLEWWAGLFDYVAQSDFLMGRKNSPGRKPFALSLPWLLEPENFAKIIDGQYHEQEAAA